MTLVRINSEACKLFKSSVCSRKQGFVNISLSIIEGCQSSIHFSCLSNGFEQNQINGILADAYNT